MNHIRFPQEIEPSDPIGGKARGLLRCEGFGVPVPDWFVLLPSAREASRATDALPTSPSPAILQAVQAAARRIAPQGVLLAVRSSALGEDGAEHSFAGQLETVLGVPVAELGPAITRVWASGESERLRAYRAIKGLRGPPPVPCVVVQRMLRPDAAGVAFGADPVTGDREVAVVSSVAGLGNALVSGEVDADTHRIRRDGTILEERIATKARREVVKATGGTALHDVPAPEAGRAALAPDDARRVAALAFEVGQRFGAPQDIEWAIEAGTLWLLQARPITALDSGPVRLWDNSNIAESYAGVTTPLTFTFAANAYAAVYRETCRLLLVSESRVDAESNAFDNLLGLIDGRMYYNLVSWYRILALLPGFRFNRRFMEQMMGVREELPADLLAQVESVVRGQNDRWAQTKSSIALVWHFLTLDHQIRKFLARVSGALAATQSQEGVGLRALGAQYRRLEGALLRQWDAPLLNDFFSMIFFGALRQTCQAWMQDEKGTLQNGLLCDAGGMISTEPPRRIAAIAQAARGDPALAALLRHGPVRDAERALRARPATRALYDAYLERFGDRCLEELKLESPTLREDPTSLIRTIGEMIEREPASESGPRDELRLLAQHQVRSALRGSPARRILFRWILRNARARVRDRENLRFERTRVFGRVRQIFAEMGQRLAEAGALEDPAHVFYLDLEELLGAAEHGRMEGLRDRAGRRREEFDAYRMASPPPDRFLTRAGKRQPLATPVAAAMGGEARTGLGCCPGIVRGTARVILDPRGAVVRAGEILVARRTDPGWILLFGAASGLVVEHGSLLSHAAIVSREMGIPSVVGVTDVTQWLRDGDQLEIDGRLGTVRRIPGAAA